MKRIENFEAVWQEVVSNNLRVFKGNGGITFIGAIEQDSGNAIHADPLTDQRVLYVRVDKDTRAEDPLHEIFVASDGTIINSGGETPLSEDEAVDLTRRTFVLAHDKIEDFRKHMQGR